MKKACLCAVIGTGMFAVMQLLNILISMDRWDGTTVHTLYAIMRPCYLVGWILVFYFFYKLYKKQ